MSEIRENARWELLRSLALIRDLFPRAGLDGASFVPLFEGEWDNPDEDIWLAAQEASKIGDIEFHDMARAAETDLVSRFIRNLRGGREAMVRITDQGRAVVKAHDALAEIEQEARHGR